MTESFGMMEGAFFVGKNEILKWLNTTYQLNLNKIEQACTGAVYCQIVDSVHPGKVKMNKVNWKAKLEHEFLKNYKILQQSFSDCKISKHVEVEKLSKGRYQDNLEFLQWFKKYVDDRRIANDYDPILRRNGSELEFGNENVNTINLIKKRDNSKPHSAKNIIIEKKFKRTAEDNLNKIIKEENRVIIPEEPEVTKAKNGNEADIPVNTKIHVDEPSSNEILIAEATEKLRQHYQERLDISNDDIAKLKMEVSTLKISISEIGRERDFYFSKLRDFEMLTSKNTDVNKEELINLMKTILFSDKEIELKFSPNGKVEVKNIY